MSDAQPYLAGYLSLENTEELRKYLNSSSATKILEGWRAGRTTGFSVLGKNDKTSWAKSRLFTLLTSGEIPGGHLDVAIPLPEDEYRKPRSFVVMYPGCVLCTSW